MIKFNNLCDVFRGIFYSHILVSFAFRFRFIWNKSAFRLGFHPSIHPSDLFLFLSFFHFGFIWIYFILTSNAPLFLFILDFRFILKKKKEKMKINRIYSCSFLLFSIRCRPPGENVFFSIMFLYIFFFYSVLSGHKRLHLR